ALAFALQETLKNLFGGVALVLDKNIKTGDIVELPDGRSGMVYDMSLRSTRIKTWDNRLIIIPNSNMANDIITNISRPDKSRRVDVLFSVAYGTDPSYVKHIVLNEIKKIPDILQDPEPRVVFNDMGNSSLDFVARYWVSESKFFLAAKEAGTIAIYDLLNKENISIPFPQREVWVHNMGKHTAKKYAKKKIPQQTTTRSKKKRVSKK
ncbi:MAG: mechanosensitive ion channel family protein, partial [Candidatus Woesearchaeota archaeon]